MDSLLSIAQMPKGVAVGTLAIGDAGAANAGLLAAQMLATSRPELMTKIDQFRANQTQTILDNPDPAGE
jgi:5-(carboxyamino)imidazole ribonucleotide mutase